MMVTALEALQEEMGQSLPDTRKASLRFSCVLALADSVWCDAERSPEIILGVT